MRAWCRSAAKIYMPPTNPGPCCTQRTITVGPEVENAKARQKHHFYSADYHGSYDRRTAVERSFAHTKDKARVDMTAGSIRMMGVTKHAFLGAIGYVVLNYRLLENFERYKQDPTSRRRKPQGRKHFVSGLTHIRAQPPAGVAKP